MAQDSPASGEKSETTKQITVYGKIYGSLQIHCSFIWTRKHFPDPFSIQFTKFYRTKQSHTFPKLGKTKIKLKKNLKSNKQETESKGKTEKSKPKETFSRTFQRNRIKVHQQKEAEQPIRTQHPGETANGLRGGAGTGITQNQSDVITGSDTTVPFLTL